MHVKVKIRTNLFVYLFIGLVFHAALKHNAGIIRRKPFLRGNPRPSAGWCHIFPRLTAEKVSVSWTSAGLAATAI